MFDTAWSQVYGKKVTKGGDQHGHCNKERKGFRVT